MLQLTEMLQRTRTNIIYYGKFDYSSTVYTFSDTFFQIMYTYCFSTAAVVTRKRLSVTLYLHGLFCLSCLLLKSGARGGAVG